MSTDSQSSRQSRRGTETEEVVSAPRFLALGRVMRPHGVRGELFLQVLTDYPDRVGSLSAVFLADDIEGTNAVSYTVTGARRHRKGLILRLEDVDDRDGADLLRDAWVLVALEDAVPLEEGEYYLFQLIGMRVVTTAGEALGVLEDVIETGANDVYVVRGGPRGEVLIPAVEHVVIEVDLKAQRMTVEPPRGLLT